MKKVIAVLSSLMILSMILAACAPAPKPTEAPVVPEAPKPVATEAPAAKFKACQVTDTGGIDDKSFNATAWKGVQDSIDQLGIEGKYLESQQQTDYEKNINAFIEEKCDIIVTVGFLLGDGTKAAAEANPNQKFSIVDYAYDPAIPNVLGQVFNTDQAGFLAGYVAAAVSKTGKVGTFGGIQIPTVTVFMDGFAMGVKYYNEKKGTKVEVLGWDPAAQTGLFTGNFESTDDGRTMGETLMDEGADIIMPVAGPVGLGTAAAIKERGNAYIIGVDADMYNTAPDYKDIILTSVLKNMDITTMNAIKSAMDGTFQGGVTVGTLENGGVGLAPFHDLESVVPAEAKTELEAVKADIIAGKIATAPGAMPAPEEPTAAFSVGVVLPTKDEPRWIQDETRFNDAFKAAGYEVQILFSQGDSAKEKANVEALIAQGVKVIIICPQDATAAAAAAQEARDAGIKVISYDRLIRETDAVDYYVTFDSIAVGAAQAQYLVDKATGTGNPLYLYAGAASDNNAFLFFEGAWNVLQPKIADGTFVIKNSSEAVALQDKATLTRDEMSKIIGQVTTEWKFDVAKNLAEANLTAAAAADKGNVFILAPNDGTARAIADVFGADKDVTSYVVTGQDAEEASVQYIIDGKQSMTVLKDVRTLVADAIAAAIAYLEGKTPEQTNTYNNGVIDVPAKPSVVITVDKSNVQSAVIDSGYWPAEDFTGLEAAPAAGAFSVGVVLPTKDEPRWIQDETRFNDAFKAAGYEVQILFSQGDSAKEKANVEALIAQGVKVIIICPQDGTAAAAAAQEARDAGIKVISYDRLIRETDAVDYYVTFDSIAVGAAQAQYLVDKATGTGNPLYLYAGAASDNNAFIFFEGAWNVLQPKIADGTFVIKNSSEAVALQDKATLTRDEMSKIIGQVTTEWKFDVAKNLAEANLTAATAADKGNVFILAPNDGTARAIADVFGADKDVTSYVVTGQDAEIASVQYIIDGKQSMTVLKDVRTLVADAIAAAIAYLEGKTPEQTNTYNNGVFDVPAKPSVVITVDKDNVKSAIIDSGYWPASEFTGLP